MIVGFGMVLCLLQFSWFLHGRRLLSVPRLLMGGDVFGDIHITKIEMGRRTDDGRTLVECRRYGFGGVHEAAAEATSP